jgi:hypothetical protein
MPCDQERAGDKCINLSQSASKVPKKRSPATAGPTINPLLPCDLRSEIGREWSFFTPRRMYRKPDMAPQVVVCS